MAFCFSHDGQRLVQAGIGNTLTVWDSQTGQPLGKPIRANIEDQITRQVVSAAAFSPDGRWLATGAEDGVVRLADATTLEPVAVLSQATVAWLAEANGPRLEFHGPRSLAFSSDSQQLIAADWHGAVRIYTLAPIIEEVSLAPAEFVKQTEDLLRLGFDEQGHVQPKDTNRLRPLDTGETGVSAASSSAAFHRLIAKASRDVQRQDFEGALQSAEAARQLDGKHALGYVGRAAAWLGKGEWDKAIADLNEAIRQQPEEPQFLSFRGEAYSNRRDYTLALADFEQALQRAPDLVVAHNGIAYIRATCPEAKYRDGEKAVKHAKRACELTGWAEPVVLDTLAAACAEAGQFDQAVRWESQAIELIGAAPEPVIAPYRKRLELFRHQKPFHDDGT
jgi:tetratricopeptide (TPR) repeat protein